MPWKSLAGKSKRLAKSPRLARAAGRQASAILRSGASEGVAIATALKHANSKMRGGNPHAGAMHKARAIKRLAGDLEAHEEESMSPGLRRARMTGQVSPSAERKHLDVDATATLQ